MNKRYEEGRKPFFSKSGEKLRKQYVWGKDEKGNNKLIETEPIDIQAEIESYADECDIKNIIRKASFDPQFAKSLVDSAKTDETMDITEWPTNIHEYHAMMATAQANAMELQRMQKKAASEPKKQEKNNEPKKQEENNEPE
jgi:ribosomal protein L12E/L44/L45/RPP1/RPP2